jgi:hypothetical protein
MKNIHFCKKYYLLQKDQLLQKCHRFCYLYFSPIRIWSTNYSVLVSHRAAIPITPPPPHLSLSVCLCVCLWWQLSVCIFIPQCSLKDSLSRQEAIAANLAAFACLAAWCMIVAVAITRPDFEIMLASIQVSPNNVGQYKILGVIATALTFSNPHYCTVFS